MAVFFFPSENRMTTKHDSHEPQRSADTGNTFSGDFKKTTSLLVLVEEWSVKDPERAAPLQLKNQRMLLSDPVNPAIIPPLQRHFQEIPAL